MPLRRPMPLAFHNTSFGRSCSTLSGAGTGKFNATRIMTPNSFAFRYAQPAMSECQKLSATAVNETSVGSARAAEALRATGNTVRGSRSPLPPPGELEIAKYSSLPLPPTPTSVISATEFTQPPTPAMGGSPLMPPKSVKRADSNRSLPPTPDSEIDADELYQVPEVAIRCRARMVDLNKPLPPSPTESFTSDSSCFSDAGIPESALSLYSQPNAPILPEPETRLLPDLNSDKPPPAWLRRVRRRASYMLKWMGQYRED